MQKATTWRFHKLLFHKSLFQPSIGEVTYNDFDMQSTNNVLDILDIG